MSNPLTPEPDLSKLPEPPEDPKHEEFVTKEEKPDKKKKYLVKTPWYVDLLQGNGVFPDITPKGVEMTGEQRQLAYEGAREAGLTLRSEEVNS